MIPSDLPDQPLAVFTAKEMLWLKQPAGQVLFFQDRLRFEIEGQPACELRHSEYRQQAELNPGARTFTIKVPAKRSFVLDRDGWRALQGWIGPPTPEDLRLALKRRFAWVMPLGGLFVLMSLPMGDLPFHLVTCVEGMVLIFIALVSRLSPHRVFFLLDSTWFLVLAVTTAATALQDASYWWGLFVVFQVSAAIQGIREYARFAPDRMAINEPPDC